MPRANLPPLIHAELWRACGDITSHSRLLAEAQDRRAGWLAIARAMVGDPEAEIDEVSGVVLFKEQAMDAGG